MLRISPLFTITTCALLCLASTVASAATQPTFPDAAASDPATLKWMVGAPPPADRTLRFEDGSYFRFPAMRWSVANFRQLMPTVNVSRGLGAPLALPENPVPGIDELPVVPVGASHPLTWRQTLDATYTDGIVVLHRGAIRLQNGEYRCAGLGDCPSHRAQRRPTAQRTYLEPTRRRTRRLLHR